MPRSTPPNTGSPRSPSPAALGESHDYLSFRADFLDDKKGQRTGYATKYSENTIMGCHSIGSTIQNSPGLRFERAWDRSAYDNARHHNQLTPASKLIVHF